MTSRVLRALTLTGCLLWQPAAASAQAFELAPFGGYRVGGGFFELLTGQPVDLDGATSFGVAVDVPLANGVQIEGLFTHQHAKVLVAAHHPLAATRWRIAVDHWQGGGLQEFGAGRVRPFLTGALGLTRYAAQDDREIRFAVSSGGGVKLFPSRHVGVRLDGRVFATFVDADARFSACSPRGCVLAFRTHVVWQADFTAGVVFRFH